MAKKTKKTAGAKSKDTASNAKATEATQADDAALSEDSADAVELAQPVVEETISSDVSDVTQAAEDALKTDDEGESSDAAEGDTSADDAPSGDDAVEDAIVVDAAEAEPVEGAEPASDEETLSDSTDDVMAEAADPAPEKVAELTPEPTSSPVPSPAHDTNSNSGLSMVFGGVVAAVLGAGAMTFLFPEGIRGGQSAELEAKLQAALAAQSDRIAALEGGPDLSSVEAQIAGASDAASAAATAATETQGAVDALSESIAALDARLTELEKQPLENTVSEGAIAAYERELASLQESVAAQMAEIEAIAADAANKEAEAASSAQATLARAALTRIVSAIDAGTPFAAALSDLTASSDVDIPPALAQVADSGVPSLTSLQGGFPDAARAALAAARSAAPTGAADGSSESTGGLGTFLARQLGARSVVPREGSDPDAVLSRVEAALGDGRLTDALAETETLPEAAKAALASWIDAATARLEAQSAAEAVVSGLNEN
ncbi:hypothetical protein ACS3SW_11905 [Roseobacteraceae bacterium S113]